MCFGSGRSVLQSSRSVHLSGLVLYDNTVYVFIVCCHGNVEKMKGLNHDIYCI